MAGDPQFDLTIIGGDLAGLAAAACAAQGGAKVALIETRADLLSPANAYGDQIPNSVWRRLKLHETSLAMRPASAFISLFDGRAAVKTYANALQTGKALAAHENGDAELWPDFLDALALGAAKDENRYSRRLKNGKASASGSAKGEKVSQPQLAAELYALSESCVDAVCDYFGDDDLQTHLTHVAMAAKPYLRAALGGDEPGSATALRGRWVEDAWPAKRMNGGRGPVRTLRTIAADAGVVFITGIIEEISKQAKRYRQVNMKTGDSFRSRHILCSSFIQGRISGADSGATNIMDVENCASALIRIKLREPVEPPEGDDDAIFFVADSVGEIQVARNAAVDGRMPEVAPISFEFVGQKEILVRAPYCPERFVDDGEEREWSRQDKQAIGAQVNDALCKHIDGLATAIAETEVKVFLSRRLNGDTSDLKLVASPASTGNSIAAAVEAADLLLAHG